MTAYIRRRRDETDSAFRARRSDAVRAYLQANSEISGDCVVWIGPRDKDGYGRLKVGGVQTRAHRAAWESRHGIIGDSTLCVLHRCDNPPCIRDEHHFLGTHADNASDRSAKGRNAAYRRRPTQCIRGHSLDADNVYEWRGHRHCRPCRRERRSA